MYLSEKSKTIFIDNPFQLWKLNIVASIHSRYSTYHVVSGVHVCVSMLLPHFVFLTPYLMPPSWWWKFNFETEMSEEQKKLLLQLLKYRDEKHCSSSHHHHHHRHRWERWRVWVDCTLYLHVSTSNLCNKLQNCKHNERFEQTIIKRAYDKIGSRAREVLKYYTNDVWVWGE